MKYKARYCSND